MNTRKLGRSGIEISPIGVGCWAIGGPFYHVTRVVAYGKVDDAESIRLLHRAFDLGINFFDTADVYGAGHSERVVGQAFAGRRDKVVIATKFGWVFDEATKIVTDRDLSPAYIRHACEASLRRLNTDYLDLYQFHVGGATVEDAAPVRDVLESLVAEGKIRAYGWSTPFVDRGAFFAEGVHCAAIQQPMNVMAGDPALLAVCEQNNLASLNRGPLGMGLLTGKYTPESQFNPDDMRRDWKLNEGWQHQTLERLADVRDVLTARGHTLAQGALAWLLARSPVTIPIPGAKTVAQLEENAGVLTKGPLSADQMAQIEALLQPTQANYQPFFGG